MISIENVSKHRGRVRVLTDVCFEARPGRVTGFIGPNGAGTSSTLRILLGLDRAGQGAALVFGQPYASLRRPLARVGAVLDGSGAHRSRTGRAHLRWVAASNGLSRRRVEEVLEIVDLTGAAGKRVAGYSLGMGRRLGLAAALLGDPDVLVLDEPVNGLDPGGIRWLRDLLRAQARAGRTVLLSSHLMGELSETVDDVGLLGPPAIVAVSAPGPGVSAAVDVTFVLLSFGVLGAVLLGVVAVSSEDRTDTDEAAATRQIVASLTAVPSRARFLVAKGVAVALTVATVAVLVTAVMLLLTPGSLGPDVWWRTLGVVVYWILTALIASAITLVTRNGVLPLVALVANTSVVSVSFLLSEVLPVARYLPDLAGQQMFLRGSDTLAVIDPLVGGLVMTAWTVLMLLVAGLAFHRRDA